MIDQSQVIESALYSIDKIRPEIEAGNFRAIYRQIQYLESLVRFAAIAQDRASVGISYIIPPRDEI